MCVHININKHACACTFVHRCASLYACVLLYGCMLICTCVCIDVQACAYVCMNSFGCLHLYVCAHGPSPLCTGPRILWDSMTLMPSFPSRSRFCPCILKSGLLTGMMPHPLWDKRTTAVSICGSDCYLKTSK